MTEAGVVEVQARAEVTRRAILDTAVQLFDAIGYRNATLAELIDATGVSKGTFYYHFTNRESVAAAIIEEADATLESTAVEMLADPSSRALGNLIRVVFEVAARTRRISLLRVGIQLRGGLGQISTATEGFTSHRNLFTAAVSTGMAEGDLRADLDADRVGHALWAGVLGTHQHCDATGEDILRRLGDVFAVMLPAICTPEAAREYGDLAARLAGDAG